jgi:hypothetical protein
LIPSGLRGGELLPPSGGEPVVLRALFVLGDLPLRCDQTLPLRHGARGLRRNPAFALAAVLTLSIGIAANAAARSGSELRWARRKPTCFVS